MARRYKVEGTRDYLYWAIGLCALGLWAVKDGWYPSESVQQRHPREQPVAFSVAGAVDEVLVAPGQSVAEGQPLARLRREGMEAGREAAEAAYEAIQARLRAAGPGEAAALREEVEATAEALQAARDRVQAAELRSPDAGEVLSVELSRGDRIEADTPAVVIRPRTSFYIFNKSLAFLSFFGAIVCTIVHQFVK